MVYTSLWKAEYSHRVNVLEFGKPKLKLQSYLLPADYVTLHKWLTPFTPVSTSCESPWLNKMLTQYLDPCPTPPSWCLRHNLQETANLSNRLFSFLFNAILNILIFNKFKYMHI